jgi:hypothetical protein
MPLLRKIRALDTLTISRDGEEPVVVQVRRVNAAEVRLCVIAPDDVRVTQASNGRILTDADHL